MKNIADFVMFIDGIKYTVKNFSVAIIENDMATYAKLYYRLFDGNLQKIKSDNIMITGDDYKVFFDQFQNRTKYPNFQYDWVAKKYGFTITGNTQNINPSILRQ